MKQLKITVAFLALIISLSACNRVDTREKSLEELRERYPVVSMDYDSIGEFKTSSFESSIQGCTYYAMVEVVGRSALRNAEKQIDAKGYDISSAFWDVPVRIEQLVFAGSTTFDKPIPEDLVVREGAEINLSINEMFSDALPKLDKGARYFVSFSPAFEGITSWEYSFSQKTMYYVVDDRVLSVFPEAENEVFSGYPIHDFLSAISKFRTGD